MTSPATRKAITKAATGATARRVGEMLARGTSSSRMADALPLPGPEHFEPNTGAGPLRGPSRGAEPAVMDYGDPVGHLEQFVEILADDENRAAGPRKVDQRLPDQAGRAGVDAPGRLIDDHELLEIAPGELAGLRVLFRGTNVESLDNGGREPAGLSERDESRPRDLPVGVMRNQGVLAKTMVRSSRMAQALLRHEGRPEAPARVDAGRGARPARDREEVRAASGPLAGESREQFRLPVARNPCDSDHLSGMDRELDIGERFSVQAGREHGQSLDLQNFAPLLLGRAGPHVPDLCSDHQRGDLARTPLSRIQGR